MEITKKEMCGFMIFELRGLVNDTATLQKIKKTIDKVVEGGAENVAIALHNADYINSGLISFFIQWKKNLSAHGKRFCLIEPSPKAMVILNLSGIDQVIPVYKNEVEFQQKALT